MEKTEKVCAICLAKFEVEGLGRNRAVCPKCSTANGRSAKEQIQMARAMATAGMPPGNLKGTALKAYRRRWGAAHGRMLEEGNSFKKTP